MRSYHVAAVAYAINRPSKWLDNLLSHHGIEGVVGTQRGVPRRISLDGAVRIAMIARLTEVLGTPISLAVSIAARTAGSATSIQLADGLAVIVDGDMLRRTVEGALEDVVERSVPARRGRPPIRREGRPAEERP